MAAALPESKRVKVELSSTDTDGDKGGCVCFIEYVELARAASASTRATLVLLHGAPGSIADFRYLLAPLADRTGGARVMALNLPGAGRSDVVSGDYYDCLATHTAVRVALRALEQLCASDEQVFLVGHSFGGHAALRLTALARDGEKAGLRTVDVRGLAFVAAVGHEPPCTYWPSAGGLLWWLLTTRWISGLESATQELVRLILTRFIGFPKGYPTSHYVAALARQATADYALAGKCLDELRELDNQPTTTEAGEGSKTSAFVAWARDDRHIPARCSEHLAATSPAGPRLAFERGGHNVQKTQAEALAQALAQWIDTQAG